MNEELRNQIKQIVASRNDETLFDKRLKAADDAVLHVLASVKLPEFENYAYLLPKVQVELEVRKALKEKEALAREAGRFQLTVKQWEKAEADRQKTQRLAQRAFAVAVGSLIVVGGALIVAILRWLTHSP